MSADAGSVGDGARAAARLRDLSELAIRSSQQLAKAIDGAAGAMRHALAAGNKLLFCGNGGSAADAQHLATEYVVRYMKNRRALPAIALTTDTSLLTAAGNDFGFDEIFARQVEALGVAGDCLIIHSTSGNSPNVLRAARAAKAKALVVIGLSARDGGALAALCDHVIIIPTDRTDRAQELHLCIQHAICEVIEEGLEAVQ
ncbi:MAG: SIS domain-containing protein [Gemmatimonadaceae bacterium]